MFLHQMIRSRVFFLRVLFLLAPLFAGCASVQVNAYYDGMPLKANIQKFDNPVIVFNPPNKVHNYDRYCIFDNNPDENPYQEVLDGNIFITDSYVVLAEWCRKFNAANTPFSLMIIDRRSTFKESGRNCLNLCLDFSVLFTIPFPRSSRFECKPEAYYSLNQGERLQAIGNSSASQPRYYGVYGEKYASLTTPLALMIPKYRGYRLLVMGGPCNEERMAFLAHDLYKERFLQDSLAELHSAIGMDKPRPLSDVTFENLIRKAFRQGYDPSKEYWLHINLGDDDLFTSGVYENGSQGLGSRFKAGHLYFVSDIRKIVGDRAWTEQHQYDLGEISMLGPVIAAWLIESGMRF